MMVRFLVALSLLVIFGLIILGWVTGIYNSFVVSRNAVDTSWSQTETQYQRRLDLIPNLVDATRGYLVHEQKIFADIAEARTRYAGTLGEEKIIAQGQLEGALARLLAIIENYPNIKADQTVRDLMFELAGTENRINVARQRFNEETRTYNNLIQVFPNNLFAGSFNFKEKPLYISEQGAVGAPKVNLEISK
jgi:LemA protein